MAYSGNNIFFHSLFFLPNREIKYETQNSDIITQRFQPFQIFCLKFFLRVFRNYRNKAFSYFEEKVKVLITQSCRTLFDPMNCSLPSSSVHGILQARIVEWVAISFSRGFSWRRDRTQVSCIAGRFFTTEPPGNPFSCIEFIAQSCPTLCDRMDCSLTGSALHRILQARVLESVAISFTRGSSGPRDRTRVSGIPGRRFNLWATITWGKSLHSHGQAIKPQMSANITFTWIPYFHSSFLCNPFAARVAIVVEIATCLLT